MVTRMNLLTTFEILILARARLTGRWSSILRARPRGSRHLLRSSATLLWLELGRPASLPRIIDLLDLVQPGLRKWAQVKHYHHWYIPLVNHQVLQRSDSPLLCLQILDDPI
jgi:hypothetical protein